MKKTFKKYLLKDFLVSEVRDCRHATWLKINFFILCNWCCWLASPGLFAVLWFTVFMNTLLAVSAISWEFFQKLWKYIVIQYPKKFYEDPYPKKLVDWSVGWLVCWSGGRSVSRWVGWLVGREGRTEGEREEGREKGVGREGRRDGGTEGGS